MSEKKKYFLSSCILTASLIVSFSMVQQGSSVSNAFWGESKWIESVGGGLIAPACGSSTIGITCVANTPSIDFTWIADDMDFSAGDSVVISINGVGVIASGLPASGVFTWGGASSNSTYTYEIRYKSVEFGDNHLLKSESFSTPNCNPDPIGWHDASSCADTHGWTCDPSNYSQPIDVHFYADGPAGSGTFLGSVTTGQSRPDVPAAGFCDGNANVGYSFATPNSLKDGLNHTIYTYAINTPAGNNPLLQGSPRTINCPAPPVTPDYILNADPNGIFANISSSGPSISSKTKITVGPINGFDKKVDLSSNVASVISGAGGVFTPKDRLNKNEYSDGTFFYVSVPPGTAAGSYNITIQGDDGILSPRSVSVILNVELLDSTFKEE
ncbi:hypothetical protein HYT00_00330 [Candidatus Giovannonibacteria bacterium]|nr:hypothetical protein [Candidatus Giovannonibacteria bacterium]